MDERFPVAVSAGTLRSTEGVTMPHAWTDEGVAVQAPFTGAHLLHVAVAGCVLNDLYREADRAGLAINGVRVTASGSFDDDWHASGIEYAVALDSRLSDQQVEELISVVDEIAEIPRALRAGTTVVRGQHG
jgi:uncharacterized OsmC-like protein